MSVDPNFVLIPTELVKKKLREEYDIPFQIDTPLSNRLDVYLKGAEYVSLSQLRDFMEITNDNYLYETVEFFLSDLEQSCIEDAVEELSKKGKKVSKAMDLADGIFVIGKSVYLHIDCVLYCTKSEIYKLEDLGAEVIKKEKMAKLAED